MIRLGINGKEHELDADGDMPLLYALRDRLGLTGTKYGCGVGICGICTVLIDGQPQHACMVPLAKVKGRAVVTIEGLTQIPDHPVLSAWIAEQVPQCGYCQPGQILAAVALLGATPTPTDSDIDAALSPVLCRCGTYQRIRRAVHRAAKAQELTATAVRSETEPLVVTDLGALHECHSLNPFVRICRDGTVIAVVARTEMGQGIATASAMLIAEELDVSLDRMRVAFAPALPAYDNPLLGEQSTGGSTSVRAAWEQLRLAAAGAREMLRKAAADAWDVPVDECRVEDGAVVHASGRRADYGELAMAAAQTKAPKKPRLKPGKEFTLIGTSVSRLDIPDMVYGRTRYAIDVHRRGMGIATVARCPVFGGRVRHYDASRARAVPGVRHVVEIASGVAVVAADFWSALRGRLALDVTWDEGENAGLASEAIRAQFAQAAATRGRTKRNHGDALPVLRRAHHVIEAAYETPYVAHACLEPMDCVAEVSADRCEVWVGTQAQTGARATAARVSGLPLSAVQVHTLHAGGGFGRRLEHDFVAEAVEVAKAVRAPVQLIFTRDDDLRHDFYRPANCALLQGAIAHGAPTAWFQRVAGPDLALGGIDIPYDIPNIRVETIALDPGIPTGAWRSVGASQNAFAVECFIDELAHAAGKDAFAFRRALLTRAPRHLKVLELAAARAGWGDPLPAGHGRGIAVYYSYNSWAAHVVEAVVADGRITVPRVVSTIDCGTVVNPDGVVAQMEGAVAQALSVALKEEITIDGGRVVQANFQDYPLLTLAEMPAVEVHIVPSHEPPGGVGEPGIPPLAPALANAVFAATGVRLRRLPLRLGD